MVRISKHVSCSSFLSCVRQGKVTGGPGGEDISWGVLCGEALCPEQGSEAQDMQLVKVHTHAYTYIHTHTHTDRHTHKQTQTHTHTLKNNRQQYFFSYQYYKSNSYIHLLPNLPSEEKNEYMKLHI